MVDACVFKPCFRRLEGINFVTLFVFYDHFYPKIWLSGYQTEILHSFVALIHEKMIMFTTTRF